MAGETIISIVGNEQVITAASAYAEHVTGYSMRDGGYTYRCRCGWSNTGGSAGAEAQKHRMRKALEALAPNHAIGGES